MEKTDWYVCEGEKKMADRPGLSGSDSFPPPLSHSIFVFRLVLAVSFSETFSFRSPWKKSCYITCRLQTVFCCNIAAYVLHVEHIVMKMYVSGLMSVATGLCK